MSDAGRAFLDAPIAFHDTGTAELAVRRFGPEGAPPLLLMHGWPLWSFTFRHLLPSLAARYACYAVDTPGAGHTRFRPDHDFSFAGQAAAFARLVDQLRPDGAPLRVVAHDTGATIARRLALIAPDRIDRLALIGTEIPGHRPPWIPLFQKTAALPGAAASFRLLLRSRAFLRSSLGLGECFADKSLLDGEFHEQFVRPLLESPVRLEGQLRYLRGIDWHLVDDLAESHRRITRPVLLLWGEDDTIFPLARARSMVAQLPDCRGLIAIPGAKLFVHEEKPAEVADHLLRFLA
jgi:pimeloyl-ACP methyl ester carboxylesterase